MMNRATRSGLLLLTLAVLLACVRSGLSVPEAWIRAAAPGGKTTVLYFTLRNSGEFAETLVAVDTPAAHRVTLHESGEHAGMSGMSGMRPRERVVVAPGETIRFLPGGLHVMLEELERDLVPGEKVPVTLHFASGTSVAVVATVRPIGAQ